MQIPQSNQKLPKWIPENIPAEILKESSLFRFVVPLKQRSQGGEKVTVDILPDLDLDYEILEEQMEMLPSQYAFWAAAYSEMRLLVAQAERNLKARKGAAIKEITDEAKDNKTKLSADLVKQIVENDKKLVEADIRLQKFQRTTGKLYHMMEALKMKAELARSLAGFKRQERQEQH